MSLYALPGLLFPPIDATIAESRRDVLSGRETTSACDVKNSNFTSTIPDQDRNEVFHNDASISAVTNKNQDETLLGKLGDSQDESRKREVGITVRQAKIDPVRLVQSSSSTSSSARTKGTRKRTNGEAGRFGIDDCDGRFSSSSSSSFLESTIDAPTAHMSIVNVKPESRPQQVYDSTTNTAQACTPHDEAIQFELSINFNGRSYVATRTLPRIIQLRNDLIRELSLRRQRFLRRKQRKGLFLKTLSSSSSSSSDLFDTAHPGRKAVLDDDDSLSVSSDEEESCLDLKDCMDITIPELPCASGTATMAVGFVGRGFTMLHALLRSYCPAMERWLLTVTSIVSPSDSPTLTKFLWEPLSGGGGEAVSMAYSDRVASLGCILEGDCDGAVSDDDMAPCRHSPANDHDGVCDF